MHRSVLILMIALLSSFRILPDNGTDKLVMQAAEGQLPVFISKIQAGDANLYGFTLEDDMDLCEIGKPYRVISFNNNFYDSSREDNKSLIIIKNDWRVPVMIKGVNRNLLTVSGTSGNYVVTSMGDTTLAKDLQYKSKGADQSDNFYLLRIPQLPADFFAHEADNSFEDATFVPLASALEIIPALSKTHKSSYTLTEVMQMVKQALAQKAKDEKPKKAKAPTTKKGK